MFINSTQTIFYEYINLHKILYEMNDTSLLLSTFEINFSIFFTFCLGSISLLSILLLIDNIIPYYKDVYRISNLVDTKKYPNNYSLILSETLNYLLQIPNLITLTIGIIQFIYTFKIIKYDLNFYINLIFFSLSLSGIYFFYNTYYKSLFSIITIYLFGCLINIFSIVYIQANIINLLVSCTCFLFSIFREYNMDKSSKIFDEIYNSNIVYSITNKNKIRSDLLELNEIIKLNYSDITPCTVEVLNIEYINTDEYDNNITIDYDLGYYNNKESTGENISKSFKIGDIIPFHRELTRPNICITAKIKSLIDTKDIKRKRSKNESLPRFLDTSWLHLDFFSFIILIIISVSISASAYAHNQEPVEIIKHIIATIISGNMIIPSMKMILLYNIYNLILRISFKSIIINRYNALEKMDNVQQVIFDKTGTLTQEIMFVATTITNNNNIIQQYNINNWNILEIEFAITMANSESNINSSSVWGTSPEENYILDYWIQKGFKLIFNPLSNFNELQFQLYDGPIRRITIIERLPYTFENGKIAKIKLNDFYLTIRQHGNDFFDSTYHINDKRRIISIAVNIDDHWSVITNYIFENPLRENIIDTIQFLGKMNIKSSILTGDGREAAENIAKNIGFSLDDLLRLDKYNSQDINDNILTISINGDILEYYINNHKDYIIKLLCSKKYNKILYRIPNYLKQIVISLIPKTIYMGDASNDALALKEAYIGICLSHGANICKLNSDIIIDEPKYILDILKTNGYKDMLVIGGQRLLKDVCWFGGLCIGSLLICIHINKFKFLNNSILYEDVWDVFVMMFISSFQYSISVLAYISSDCHQPKLNNTNLIFYSIVNIIYGLILGLSISWFIKNLDFFYKINLVILHMINMLMLFRHSIHCLKSKNIRQYDGVFGNQYCGYNKSIIIFLLNILDSIPFRIILYFFFYIIFPI